MLKLVGSARRSFVFPADLPTAYSYYGDLGYILKFLPHISVVKLHTDDHFRILYSAKELGAYSIQVFCDLRATLDGGRRLIRIVPEEALPPIEATVSFYKTSGRGYFTMESLFTDAGDKTVVEFNFRLKAQLPKPRGMRLMIGSVVDRVTRNITANRMQEITDGFVQQSIAAFPDWNGAGHLAGGSSAFADVV